MDPCNANLSVGPNLVKPIAKGFIRMFQIYLFPMHRKRKVNILKNKTPTPCFLKCLLKKNDK
jgi:hypothetical protein